MSKSTWERTPVQNLLRNSGSGRYFGRWTLTVNGRPKQVWRSLGTDVLTVARLRLTDEAAKIEGMRASGAAVAAGKGCVGDLMATYEQRTNSNPDLKASSITARLVSLKQIKKTWPDLEGMKPSAVTPEAVQAWAARFKAHGTNPAAQGTRRGNSATSVNRSIDTLRRIMDIAVEQGAIHRNPVAAKPSDGRRLKKKVVQKRLDLPSNEDLHRLFAAIESGAAVAWRGLDVADFCRFIAFSGCRVGEVPAITWSCVDWGKKLLRVPGFKTETSNRTVPLFADLEALLRKVAERRKDEATHATDGKPTLNPAEQIFPYKEVQTSIDNACATAGVSRITHHGLRHFFATRCIEAGVDIPTVSRWLGHSDGGVLAMRTYGHLRQEHSQTQAAKVNFGAEANP